MSYKEALEAAGAEVLEFAYFGDYSGTWVAKVSYKGEVGWIHDWFGSCSYCDAFEADFSYSHEWGTEEYNKELAAFGERYLKEILPAQHFLDMWEKCEDYQDEYAARKFILECEHQIKH